MSEYKNITDRSNSPFFIVGSGRSGSTLLRMILSEHSKTAIPPETWYLLPLVDSLPISSVLCQDQVDLAIEIMTKHYRWPDLHIDSNEFTQEVMRLKDPTLRKIIDIVYNKKMAEEGKSIWGDKTPPYVKIIPELNELYPCARFLYLVRDGRDVTQSFQSKRWHSHRLHDNTKEWKLAAMYFKKYKDYAFKDRIMVVRYEDMVQDINKTAIQICNFLGIEFEPRMLAWEESVTMKVPEREAYAHTKLLRKPKDTDIYRWKRELSAREILIIESFIGKELRESGYDLHYSNPIWKPVFLITRIYCKTMVPIYDFCKRGILFVWRRAVILKTKY
jgi:hypothetical protein